MTRPRLLITRSLPAEVLAEAGKRFDVSLWPRDEPIGSALLPHIGSATVEARTAMGLVALQGLSRWLHQGQASDNCLNPSTLQARMSA